MLKIYTLLIFFIFTSLPAEIINKLEITGNQRVSSETIKMFANVTEGNDFDSNDFNTTLKNLYNTNFFDLIELNIWSSLAIRKLADKFAKENVILKEFKLIPEIDLDSQNKEIYKL